MERATVETTGKSVSVTRVTDMTQWLTRQEVGELLGVSQSTVRRHERAGKLHGQTDAEGTIRFFPAEVAILKAELDDEDMPRPSALAANIELAVVSRVLGLVDQPRRTIDELQFRIIRELRAELVELRAENAGLRARATAAEEGTHIRAREADAAVIMSKGKADGLGRLVDGVVRALGGGTGSFSDLNAEQLQGLIEGLGGTFFTKPQMAKLQQAFILACEREKKAAEAAKASSSSSSSSATATAAA